MEVDLFAPIVQLNDEDRDRSGAGAPPGPRHRRGGRGAPEGTGSQETVRKLCSVVLRSLTAVFSVAVQEVNSGPDRLGSGSPHAFLAGGRLAVDLMTLNIPVAASGRHVHPGADGYGNRCEVRPDRPADEGVLARIDRKVDDGGSISVDVDFTMRETGFSGHHGRVHGYLDFAVHADLNAGLFDLWAVNLLTAPSLDPSSPRSIAWLGCFSSRTACLSTTAPLSDTADQAWARKPVDFRDNSISLQGSCRDLTAVDVYGSDARRDPGVKFRISSSGHSRVRWSKPRSGIITSPIVPFMDLHGPGGRRRGGRNEGLVAVRRKAEDRVVGSVETAGLEYLETERYSPGPFCENPPIPGVRKQSAAIFHICNCFLE